MENGMPTDGERLLPRRQTNPTQPCPRLHPHGRPRSRRSSANVHTTSGGLSTLKPLALLALHWLVSHLPRAQGFLVQAPLGSPAWKGWPDWGQILSSTRQGYPGGMRLVGR